MQAMRDNGPEEVMVWMKDIKVLPEMFQTRDGLNMKIVNIYSKRMMTGAFPPVLVYRLPDGKLVLADGFHRHAASKSLKRDKIKAIVREGTVEDAILAGLKANQEIVDERALTMADKAHAVKVMLRNETFRDWPDRQIAALTGAGRQSVPKLRLQLSEEEDIAIPDRVRTFKDGKPTSFTYSYRKPWAATGGGGPVRTRMFASDRYDGCYAKINGKHTYLGQDPEAAAKALEVTQQEIVALNRILADVGNFSDWLVKRGVVTTSHDSLFGGILVGGIVAKLVPNADYEATIKGVGWSQLVHAESGGSLKPVLIGYFGSMKGLGGKVVSVAAQLAAPPRFMTPEEFVEAFKPKEGES